MFPSAHHTDRSLSRAPVAVAATLALLLAACGLQPDGTTTPPIDNEPSPEKSQSSPDEPGGSDDATAPNEASDEDVDAMAFTECEADRYTVGHPEDWNTNGDDGLLGPCEIFHPGDIEVIERPRDIDLHYAALMYVDEVDFDERLAADNPNEVIAERETTVEGRRAHVTEYRSTGEALTPEGESSYTWAIDLDGQILVATTSSVGETDYERDKQVIDRMVTEELTIHDQAEMVAGPSTTEQSTEEPDGWPLAVTDVRVGEHGSFDRITFEIAGDGQAGWLVEYDDDPRSQGRGDPVDVEGDAVLRVALRSIAYPTDAPAKPYDGPERIQPERTDAIVEVLQDVLYEGYQDFFVGLDSERPYRVERLDDPQRVVIDIETD